MNRFQFCQSFVHLNGTHIDFAGRPYLEPIYAANGNLVIRALAAS